MKKIRIIPRLDVKGPNVVKGIQLEGLRLVGSPQELARKYYAQGADEILYMDIVASLYNRNNLSHIVEETTRNGFFVPITVGGGLRSIEDIRQILRSGADKIAVNTAAIKNPGLIREAARLFGSSTIVLSVEAKKIGPGKWEAYTDNGRERTGRDVLEWVVEAVGLGAGEVLVTSVDHEGMKSGLDLELMRLVSQAVTVPVVASGGAGKMEHIVDCLADGNLDGIALASVLHYDTLTIQDIKAGLNEKFPGQINTNHCLDRVDPEPVEKMISIVDYGLCNLRSVENTLKGLGVSEVRIAQSADDLQDCEFLILPGVGAFEEGMRNLKARGLDRAIRKYAESGKPLLGICLGMQLLMSKSFEFGEHSGLNLIPGQVVKFFKETEHSPPDARVPHVGWNQINAGGNSWNGTILESIPTDSSAYFVHSYYVVPESEKNILATTRYFDRDFCSVIRSGSIYGCQFHPEKSGDTGLKILSNFLKGNSKEWAATPELNALS